MKENFGRALLLVLQHEGGWVNNRHDPGGETSRGVTQAVYNAWRLKNQLPQRRVRFIEDAEVQKIYYEQYWRPIRANDLPSGVDYALFDFAVNSGVRRAAITLQRILVVAQDGIIGNITLASANMANPEQLINAICDARLGFMRRLSIWRHFGKGWSRRVAEVREKALHMAALLDKPATA